MNSFKGLRTERGQVDDAVRLLTEAGYPLVELQPGWASKLGVRPDIVAWGADEDGSLVPLVLVEAKVDLSVVETQLALALLSTTASVLGTRTNLLRVRDQWFLARDGFLSMDQVSQVPQARPGPAVVRDPEVAARLFGTLVWSQADKDRDRAWHKPTWDNALEQLLDASVRSPDGRPGMVMLRDGVLVPYDVLIRGWVDYVLSSGGREAGEHLTPRALATTMADLAGPYSTDSLVLDPFAGYGTGLAYAALAARDQDVAVNVFGREINLSVARTAQLLVQGMDIPGQIAVGDSFREPMPSADFVISAPPWGLKLREPVETPFGLTTNGDVAAIALCAQSLRPGGRAVLHTLRSWTFSGMPPARDLRRWLLDNFHVAALISLPPLSRSTNVSGIIVVIDRPALAPATTDTIVANLQDDWAEQLAPGAELREEVRSRRWRSHP